MGTLFAMMHRDLVLFTFRTVPCKTEDGEGDLRFCPVEYSLENRKFFPVFLKEQFNVSSEANEKFFSDGFKVWLSFRDQDTMIIPPISEEQFEQELQDNAYVSFNDNFWIKEFNSSCGYSGVEPYGEHANLTRVGATPVVSCRSENSESLDELQGPAQFKRMNGCCWYRKICADRCEIFHLKADFYKYSLYLRENEEIHRDSHIFNFQVYAEYFASQVAKALNLNAVEYRISRYTASEPESPEQSSYLVCRSPLINNIDTSLVIFFWYLQELSLHNREESRLLSEQFSGEQSGPLLTEHLGSDYADLCLFDRFRIPYISRRSHVPFALGSFS
mgnify:CR=1 FL=1